ncbi:MAG: crossover junction endodeoxyribonuclease RuvC [Luteibaculum sp.]
MQQASQVSEQVIMGIDPGTTIMGYGVIATRGSKIKLLTYGVVNLSKYEGHAQKLRRIFERISDLIEGYKPDFIALEAPFYGKNVQSMLKLGRAQGVAMAAGLTRDIPISEYAPKKIKQAITGSGNASKEQVAGMLQKMFQLKELPEHLDATDGLAAAVCHHHALHSGTADLDGSKASSWKAFIGKNPKRVN